MRAETQEETFWDHVGSLRSHLLASATIFVLLVAGSFGFLYPLMTLVLRPHGGEELVFLTVLGPLLFQMKLAFLLSAVASIGPWIAIAVHFASPALEGRTIRGAALFAISAVVMAALALVGTYAYLFPLSLQALLATNVPGTKMLLTADSYLDFFLLETLVACFVSELPVVLALCAHLGWIDPRRFSAQRPLLYVGLAVAMAIMTPTTDAASLLLVLVPSVLSLEIGLLIARAIHTRHLRTAAK